ncbi:MAG: hypothetical protein HDT16_04200 [Oscillibacter sp.]|nr:hypothetical protein [Oscillibacter sp.]
MAAKPVLQIRMLGGCSLTYGDKTISDPNYHLKKPWMLLAYLITFRSQEIPVDELINLLYPGETGSRPTGALKTLVYRVREMLDELGLPDSRDMILVSRGSYAWNAGVPIQLDADLFELACQRSGAVTMLPEERLELCRSALALYRGDLLSKAAGERWVSKLIPCYHIMYTRLVQTTAGLLAAQERWDELIQVCGRAIEIDGYEESFYHHLIRGLLRTGQTRQAMERYKRMYSIFYTELGVTPSEETMELYREITQESSRDTSREAEDLAAVSRFLLREDRLAGAFFCDLEVFTDIYNLEARSMARSGRTVYLAMVSASMRDVTVPPLRMLNSYMERLEDCIRGTLRRGDVVAQYSVSQFILLLPVPSADKGQIALDRIISRFTEKYPRCPLLLRTSIREVDAILV